MNNERALNWAPALRAENLTARVVKAPAFVREIIDWAKASIAPSRVYVFGSQARGNARASSDLDLAFLPQRPEAWGAFATRVAEEARALIPIDVVNLSTCQESLRRQIEVEGILLYESR